MRTLRNKIFSFKMFILYFKLCVQYYLKDEFKENNYILEFFYFNFCKIGFIFIFLIYNNI